MLSLPRQTVRGWAVLLRLGFEGSGFLDSGIRVQSKVRFYTGNRIYWHSLTTPWPRLYLLHMECLLEP